MAFSRKKKLRNMHRTSTIYTQKQSKTGDVRGQQGMNILTRGHIVIDYGLTFWFQVKMP